MVTIAAKTNRMRVRGEEHSGEVTQIELFFDLVFAFAVTQLSETLRAHIDPLGLLHTLILFAAVWWVWVYTVWATNWLDPDAGPVRVAVICLTLVGLMMSAALPDAFGERAIPFACAYVGMQVCRNLFMVWSVQNHNATSGRNFLRITLWSILAGAFWLSGAFAEPEDRLYLWLIALSVELLAPAVRFISPVLGASSTREWAVDSEHMAERCAGFILIAVGESVADTGSSLAELDWSPTTICALFAAFAGILILWWIYFDKGAERTAECFARSSNPGHIARVAYTYMHGVLVAGIVITAAGDTLILKNPHGPVTWAAGFLLLGGPALYLLANLIFRRLLLPRWAPSHRYGLGLLALACFAAPHLDILGLSWLVDAILLTVVVLSEIFIARQKAK